MSDYGRLGRRRSGRRRRRLVMVVLGTLALSGVIFFAPTLILESPLRMRVLEQFSRDLDGSVAVKNVSAGWFSPIRIDALSIRDSAGQPLLDAEAIYTDKTLLSLFLNRRDVGTVTIDHPHLHLSLREDGSNVEDSFAKWFERPRGEAIGFGVTVVNGQMTVSDQADGSTWVADDVQLSAQMPLVRTRPTKVQFASTWNVDGQEPGALQVNLQSQTGGGTLRVESARAPLRIFEPLLRRYASGAELAGTATGVIELEWSDQDKIARFEQVQIQELTLGTHGLIADDRIRLKSLDVNGTLTMSPEQWRLEALRCNSDVASITGQGAGTFPATVPSDYTSQMGALLRGGAMNFDARIDLAILAQRLPRTLRLREGTQVASGVASVQLRGEAMADGNRWNGKILADQLRGSFQGDPIRWEQPLEVSFAVQQQGTQWSLDALNCRASFLEMSAKGTIGRGTATLEADLNRFGAELGRFLDLGESKIAGRMEGTAEWRLNSQGAARIDVSALAQDFTWSMANQSPWYEKQLGVTITARGQGNEHGIQQLDMAQIDIESAADNCHVELTGPVAPVRRDARWPLAVKIVGNLNRWATRLERVTNVAVGDWDGNGEVSGEVIMAGSRIDIVSAKGDFRNLTGPLWNLGIVEPRLQAELAGTWDAQTQSGAFANVTLAGSAVALRAEKLDIVTRPQQFALQGRIGYRADLARLSDWVVSSDHRLTGQMTGFAELTTDRRGLQVQLSGEAKEFNYAVRTPLDSVTRAVSRTPDWQTIWAEQKLTYSGFGNFEQSEDRAVLTKVELTGQALSLGAAGTIVDIANRCELELQGEIAYDLAKLSRHFSPQLRQSVQITGRNTQPFSFRGPLKSRPAESGVRQTRQTPVWEEILANATMDWDSTVVGGFAIGPGKLNSKLRNGVVTLNPVKLDVSGGRVSLAPQFDLRTDPVVMRLPSGPAAEQVRISPAMCNTWLKYLTPIAADATAVEGRFSINLDDAVFPMSAPATGRLTGTLSVHNAQIGPGPLTREFLLLADQVKAILERRAPTTGRASTERWVAMPEQQIAFHLENRRVHHKSVRFQIEDVQITTSGSVGLDQSLALTAVVPIQDEWVARDRWLSSLRGQTLQIPVRGSLSKPKLDVRVLDNLTREFVTGAASRLLEQEIGRGLDRLFAPRP